MAEGLIEHVFRQLLQHL